MLGWWKPIVAYGGAVGLFAAFLYARPEGSLAGAALTLVLGTGFLVLVRVASWWPAGRFLAGLRDAGPARVTRDEVDWFGNRALTVETAMGAWRIRAVGGKAARLEVHGPRMAGPAVVKGNPRKAGRAAADVGGVPTPRR